MPTIHQYFYRSVRNFFLILALIILLILAMAILGWIVPTKIYNEFLFYSLYFVKEIGLSIVFGVLVFLGYKVFRVFKTEQSPGQEFIKMAPAVSIWVVIIFSVTNFTLGQSDETDCQKYNYNDKLNGGVKEFNGKKYTINICGSGINNNRFFGNGMDKVRLEVLNNQGELLAKRQYKVFWGGQPGHEPIKAHQDSISYEDDADTYGKPRTITMPPTFIDWIRARIPLLD